MGNYVFSASDKVRLNSTSSASETSLIFEILHIASMLSNKVSGNSLYFCCAHSTNQAPRL